MQPHQRAGDAGAEDSRHGTGAGERGDCLYATGGRGVAAGIAGELGKISTHATEIDPLVRLAVAHYQFEAIHPFTDGNGRTGRVLNSLFFVSEGLLTLPILYLSRYIIQHKGDYYRLLREVTQTDEWEEWILFVLKGVEATARWTTTKIEAIRNLQKHTTDYVQKASPKIYSYELINLIFELPYCRIQNVTQRGVAVRQTASSYLKELVKLQVLEEKPVGREKLFIHPKLLQLLTRDANEFTPYG